MKRGNCILIFMMISSLACFAQTSNLSLLDFYALPEPIIRPYPANTDTSTARFDIRFKCSDFSQTDTVFILFGSTQGNADIMSTKASMIYSNSMYKLFHNGNEFPITGNWDANMFVTITKQDYKNVNYVDLYVKDKSGNTTPHVTYRVTH